MFERLRKRKVMHKRPQRKLWPLFLPGSRVHLVLRAFSAVDDFGNTATRTATINVVYGCGDTYLNNNAADFLTPVSLLRPFKLGSTGGADTGNYFRVSGAHYMYNLYTKSLSTGSYQIQAVLDDGTTRTIQLGLKP